MLAVSNIAIRKLFAVLLLMLLAFCPVVSLAQSKVKIRLEHANSMKNLKVNGENIIRHIGNVRFIHNDTHVTCDSSRMNSTQNFFDAYGHVVITQGNTKIIGDKLHFDGNTSLARVWGKEVVMVDENTRLVTTELLYNTREKYAYYHTKGVVKSDDLDLTSTRGYLYNEQSKVIFAGNVVMHNADGDAFTDSLDYSSKLKIANFYGPSYLFYQDNFIYCERGTYNVQLKQATASIRAYLLGGEQKLFGDNIFYDDSIDYAYANGNVVVVDTTSNIFVYGQKAQYWKSNGRAKVTESPYVAMVDKNDTLFLKADTLVVDEFKTPQMPDSTYNLVRGLGNVKFYRRDVQGLCDSLSYNTFDSIMVMHSNPVLWQGTNQMTADVIRGFSRNNVIERINFNGNAFIVMEEAPKIYNQLRGKEIIAHFNNGDLYKVDVDGNGQAVYYMRDGDEISMVNRVESANIVISVGNNKIKRIRFNKQPKSNLYPVELAQFEDVTLKGFSWKSDFRPADKYSIVPANFVVIPVETGAKRRDILKKSLAEPKKEVSGGDGLKVSDEKLSPVKDEPKPAQQKKSRRGRKGLLQSKK